MMSLNTIKEETEDMIILANDSENVIMSLFCFIAGLIVLWFFSEDFFTDLFNYSNTSDNFFIVLEGMYVAIGGLFIWGGFEYLLFKSKAEIDKNHQKIIIERKSIIKCLESVSEVFLRDIIKIEIEHKTSFEGYNSWDIYFITNTGKSKCFFMGYSESKSKKLADKISQLINPQLLIHESEVTF